VFLTFYKDKIQGDPLDTFAICRYLATNTYNLEETKEKADQLSRDDIYRYKDWYHSCVREFVAQLRMLSKEEHLTRFERSSEMRCFNVYGMAMLNASKRNILYSFSEVFHMGKYLATGGNCSKGKEAENLPQELKDKYRAFYIEDLRHFELDALKVYNGQWLGDKPIYSHEDADPNQSFKIHTYKMLNRCCALLNDVKDKRVKNVVNYLAGLADDILDNADPTCDEEKDEWMTS